jgi:type II secretory pathway component GspD/PulD (secretin)
MRKRTNILITLVALVTQVAPALSNQELLFSNYQSQDLISANNVYLAANPAEYDEEDEWEDDDEFWEDEDPFYSDEPEVAPAPAPRAVAPAQPARSTNVQASSSPSPASDSSAEDSARPIRQEIVKRDNREIDQKIQEDLDAAKQKREESYIKLAQKFKRSTEDLENLYSQYGDILSGLNPDNPKDLKEIEKLIEIVGIPKREKKIQAPTIKKAPKDDPIVNFSARSIPIRDAFATLARVSGKSITVSGQIQDRDLISVVEINNQPFTQAFLSLVEASDVDFSVGGDNYTILKKRGPRTTALKADINSTDVDLSLPLEERYADLIYDNEDLSSIIKDLANKYGVDVVMTANPTERITLRVRGVNIEDAFSLVFAGSQFQFTRRDDTFVVYSSTNKNFSLDRKTVLFPLKYLEAQNANKLLPAELKALVQVSDNQNAFIAEGSKAELTKLFDFIRTIDKPIPQVELNVKLVEVSQDFTRQNNIFQDSFGVGKMGTLKSGLDANNKVVTRVLGLNADLGLDQWGVFQRRPSFQQTNKDSQLKVNQRLLVTSGKSAKINFDKDRNIILGSANTEGSNTIGVVQSQRIQRVTAGNSMDITPIVGGGGVVTVKLDVEVSANNNIDSVTGLPRDTLRRRISSEVQVIDNETIAIGGLFDDSKGNVSNNQIPLLSNIPVIGNLFKNNSKNKNLTELIILITPKVRTGEETEQIYVQAQGN